MTSIMGNPKLSKQFREAMSAPIGSTKREQIKATLSIMQKVKGLNHDGKGGPLDSMAPASGSVLATPTNFGNMMIFPAAPSLKKQVAPAPAPAPTKNTFDLKLSPTYSKPAANPLSGNTGAGSNSSFSGIQNFPQTSSNQYGINLKPTTSSVKTGLVQGSGTPVYSNISSAVKSTPTSSPTQVGPQKPDTSTPSGIMALQVSLNNQFKNDPTYIPLKVDGIMGPKTQAAQSRQTAGANTGTSNTISNNLSTGLSNINSSNDEAIFNKLFGGINSTKTPPKILGSTSNVTLNSLANALVSQESGGDYTVVNKDSGALGKYQIMPFNLGYAGLTDTPENRQKFLATPALQDKAFGSMINELYTKYDGDLVKVAAAYYGGGGAASKVGTDAGDTPQGKYPSINDYVRSVLTKAGLDTGSLASNDGGSSGSSSGTSSAQSYIDAGKGAYAYGSDLAKGEFGGKNLTQVIMDNTEAYRKSLEPLEIQLSNLKAESENFVPTLTAYMEGRDKYVDAIDDMIKDTEKQMLNGDMSDPNVSSRYNSQLTYLYTLKGRQNTRYGNYLNSAVSDYNAEVTKMQSNYDTFKANATELLNNQNALDQTIYNDIMTRGEAVYAELENAPIKAANLALVNQQLGLTNLSTVQNGLAVASAVVNPDYYKDITEYRKQYTIDNGATDPGGLNGTLDFSLLPTNGLAGIYAQNAHQGGDPAALTEVLRTSLNKTLAAYGSNPAKITEIKKLVSDLAAYETAAYDSNGWDPNVDPSQKTPFSSQISGSVLSGTQTAYTSYITSNIAEVKDAAKDLISKSGGFLGMGGSTGIADKASWMKKHSTLDSTFLEALYSSVSNILQSAPAYANNPSAFLKVLFPGPTDNEDATSLSKVVALAP